MSDAELIETIRSELAAANLRADANSADADRYRWAIALEDNAETLYAAVMNNAPIAADINAEIDAERAAGVKA